MKLVKIPILNVTYLEGGEGAATGVGSKIGLFYEHVKLAHVVRGRSKNGLSSSLLFFLSLEA